MKTKNRKPIDIPIPEELNDQQKAAYTKMVDFIKFDHNGGMFLLEGYAGTGKTYLVGKLLDYIFQTRTNYPIACSAPTNKAVKVLRRSSQIKNEAVNFSTIHSLLGLQETITEDGKQIFVAMNNAAGARISEFKLLIIDEVSMLNDDLFHKIQKHASRIKIIFMGDPAQIPPVMKNDCIPFLPEREQYAIQVCSLTEIMRQKKGNSIIETSFAIRENLTFPTLPLDRTIMLNEDDKGVIHIDNNDKQQRDKLIETLKYYFTDQKFKDNPDYAKVISWTNKSVAQMNKLIRNMIFKNEVDKGLGHLPKIMVGEKLIANKPIVKHDEFGKQILFTSNDEFEVISYEIHTDKRFFFYYLAEVEETLINGEKQRKKINILHEDSEAEFNKKLNEIKREALTEHDPVRKKSAWRYYYDFMVEYADINYGYAISAHKAQGSSYTNTFVLEDDIDQNHKVIERNRIKYTACTRATDKLFLIHRQ